MICISDGLFESDLQCTKCRISSTFALSLLSEKRTKFPLLGNPSEISCMGSFLEMETLSAAVIGSRTYPNSLSGSPLEFFLQSFIGELNPSSDYVSFDGIKNIPSVYADMKVALLSAATCTWRENSDNLFVLQNSTIVLGACTWSCNTDKSKGPILLFTDLTATLIIAIETKCYQHNIPTQELIKTMKYALCDDNLITIMIVPDFGTIRSSDENFQEVTKDVIVAMVEGNANEGRPVATELAWKRMNIRNIKRKVTLERTMIIIDLESIYCNRYAGKAFAYKIIRRILLD